MEAVQSTLNKFGNNFSIGSFIPSLAFSLAFLLLNPFRSLLGELTDFSLEADLFLEILTGVILIAMILGFTLSKVNTLIYKLYEGYFFPREFQFLRIRQLRKARMLKNKLELLKKLRDWTTVQNYSDDEKEKRLDNLNAKMYAIASSYEMKFPKDERQILPTPFGNILKAAEEYPNRRYGIDAVVVWPRLYSVIPEHSLANFNFINDSTSFLLNTSVLSLLFTLISILFMIYGLITEQPVLLETIPTQFINITIGVTLFIGFAVASHFYVGQYGNAIRSSYDLYRFQLLEQLNIKFPEDYKSEKMQYWPVISEFYACGDQIADINLPEYCFIKQLKKD